jgi:23S rRNA A1618 N6-methylase RlmF
METLLTDFGQLAEENPGLKPYVCRRAVAGGFAHSVDFNDPKALRALSAAMLKSNFGVRSRSLLKRFLLNPFIIHTRTLMN